MKNKMYFPLIFTILTVLVGFRAGEEVELESFVNSRSNASFLKHSKNSKTTLSIGTRGEILEVKKFKSGNSGIKIKVSNGPKHGESYWVYYNVKNPTLKLIDKKRKEVEAVKIEEAANVQLLQSVAAIRDSEESAVLDAVQETEKNLDGKTIPNSMTTQSSQGCPVEAVAKSNIEAAPLPPILSETPPIPNIEPLPEVAPSLKKKTYSPQMALADINSGELKFIRRDSMPDSDLNKTCVFQNAKVYVLYDNCMANRKEYAAASIDVISRDGGMIHFNLENFDLGKPNSQLPRNKYNGLWDITYYPTKVPGDMNIAAVKKYMQDLSRRDGGCFIASSSGKATDLNTKANCYGSENAKLSDWGPSAESFWLDPPTDWYSTQTKLRKLVETVPF